MHKNNPPYIHSGASTQRIMLDVVVALLPAVAAALYFFGLRSGVVIALSTTSAMAWEWFFCRVSKLPCTVADGSAAVTGLLLALCLPVTVPLWLIPVANGFAIVVVKQFFGGLGYNFVNPALCGRALLFSWPMSLLHFVAPHTQGSLLGSWAEVTATATPLHTMQIPALPSQSALTLFVGNVAGSLGETSALCLLLGGVYLLVRRVITPTIPLTFLATVAALTFALSPLPDQRLAWMAANLWSGGLVLGAIFMATDYVTSPVTIGGQVLYGVGCGALTVFLRTNGIYPEGVTYAILLMNLWSWALDRVAPPRRFGEGGIP